MRTDTIHARRLPLIATTAAAALGACAGADFIGWMTTKRVVPGGYLINVFAATNNSADNIISLSGGTVGFPSAGFVRTNSAGGFLQGVGTQSVFAPTPSQSWTTVDSFLTVGGGFTTSSNTWRGNSATVGGPEWQVPGPLDEFGEPTWVDCFKTPSNDGGFTNPYMHIVPEAPYLILVGSSSQARSLASLDGIRLPYALQGQRHMNASSHAAATASHGFLVGQLYVSEWGGFGTEARYIDWKSRCFVRGPGGEHNAIFEIRVGEICVGDLNQDGMVDGADLGALLAGWGPCTAACEPDMNNDGAVDGVDLGLLLAAWGPCTG